MGKTTIEWTNRTWNPIRGCSMAKGSETGGCLNCYAAAQAVRFSGPGDTMPDGKTPGPFHRFARRTESGPRWTGKVELVEKHLGDPLRWRKPQRVFVNSMSDLFHEGLPFEAIDEVFTVMIAAPQHTYQILTKRSRRMLEYFRSGRHDGGYGPDRADYHLGENIWLGVSVEDQKTADERIPLLLQTPAVVRFVSYEPALGPVNFFAEPWTITQGNIHWVIVGGESGPGARPFDIQWARNTVEQCKVAGVACFVKQLGSKPFNDERGNGKDRAIKDRKGGDWSEWEPRLRVREFPNAPVTGHTSPETQVGLMDSAEVLR